MIIAVVEIQMPPQMRRADIVAVFRDYGPKWHKVPGLIRKYYTLGDHHDTGGVFLWQSREAAEAAYADPAWHKLIQERYGASPRVTYYDIPVIVDNEAGRLECQDVPQDEPIAAE